MADLTRQAHGVEREKGTRGGNGSALANRAHKTERESERAKETGADRLAPLSSERARERGRSGLRRQARPACQADRACGRGCTRVGWA
jgi:hypothetical protein